MRATIRFTRPPRAGGSRHAAWNSRPRRRCLRLSATRGRSLYTVPHAAPEMFCSRSRCRASHEIAAETAAAHDGWKHWRRTTLDSRYEVLDAVANALDAAAPELASQMAIEIGKPFTHGLEEVRRGAANVRDVIRRARDFSFIQPRGIGGAVRHATVGCGGAHFAVEQSGSDSGWKDCAGPGLWEHSGLEAGAGGDTNRGSRSEADAVGRSAHGRRAFASRRPYHRPRTRIAREHRRRYSHRIHRRRLRDHRKSAPAG